MSLRAFGGGPLLGEKPLRFIYVDESGFSTAEPVTVVVSVIVHADDQWRPLATYLQDIRDTDVPEHLRENFIFHASDLLSGKSLGEPSPRRQSRKILQRLLAAPRLLSIPLAVGFRRRDVTLPKEKQFGALKVRTAIAFILSVARANAYIRDFVPDEVGTIVAENNSEMRRIIKDIPGMLRDPVASMQLGVGELLPFGHIVDTVHLAQKTEAPLLQLADACAFAIRRRMAGYEDGKWMAEALGLESTLAAFDRDHAPAGGVIAMWASKLPLA